MPGFDLFLIIKGNAEVPLQNTGQIFCTVGKRTEAPQGFSSVLLLQIN